MTCAHGREGGSFCPHCVGVSGERIPLRPPAARSRRPCAPIRARDRRGLARRFRAGMDIEALTHDPSLRRFAALPVAIKMAMVEDSLRWVFE